MAEPKERVHRSITGAVFLGVLLTLVGCGGGGGGSSSPLTELAASSGSTSADDTGTVIVGITDAEGDFLSYVVDVNRIRLARANGDVVETIPLSTSIDFAELTELTELFSTATVPVGDYTSVSMTLDYTDAVVLVQDELGATAMATLQDAAGQPLGEVEVDITLGDADAIRIRPGIPAAVTLDFDLAASNTIESFSPALVTVEPFVLAEPQLEGDRQHRVRGLLDGVDVATNSFQLAIRPFRHRAGGFGELDVSVGEDTIYEINEVVLTGADGLAELAALDTATFTVVLGSPAAGSLTATHVRAGSSVPEASADIVKGVVAARSDNVLTVTGALIQPATGSARFRDVFSVTVGTETVVSKERSELSVDHEAISVGSQLLIAGVLVEESDTLDATNGRAQLRITNLNGEVTERGATMLVDLFSLSARRPGHFDFSGTGVDVANDADADAYEVDLQGLGSDLEVGDWVRIAGFVADFGAAPADFVAQTVVDVDTNKPARVLVSWREVDGSANPFTVFSADGLTPDLTDANAFVELRGVPRRRTADLVPTVLLPDEDGSGVYAVRTAGSGSVALFRSFADLVAALTRELEAGNELLWIDANGQFHVETGALQMQRGKFVFTAGATE